MAERLEGVDLSRVRASDYPWEDWADGKVWRLTAGKDFDGSGHRFRRFRSACYAAAERLGCRVVTVVSGPDMVDVQFIRDEPSPHTLPRYRE